MNTVKTPNTFPTFKYYSVSDNPLTTGNTWDHAYLYVGNNEIDYNALKTDFKSGFAFDSLEKGIQFLCHYKGEQKISVIFIDLPFCYTSLHVFLSEKEKLNELANVPVILNIRNLTIEEISFVRRKKMADEMVDFKVEMDTILEKIQFLHLISISIAENRSNIKIENKPSSVYPDTFFLKRTLDMIISIFFIIALFPLFLLISLAIKIESRGPIFFNSYRAGRGFKIFKLYHFRTMKVGADRTLNSFLKLNKFNNFGHAPVFLAPENDPRITRVGHFLCKSGLNKLPSLINVLNGNLSIVGKDPLRLYEATSMSSKDSTDRFALTSGLSGMWKFPVAKANSFPGTKNSKPILAEEMKENAFTEFLTKISTTFDSIHSFNTSSTKGR